MARRLQITRVIGAACVNGHDVIPRCRPSGAHVFDPQNAAQSDWFRKCEVGRIAARLAVGAAVAHPVIGLAVLALVSRAAMPRCLLAMRKPLRDNVVRTAGDYAGPLDWHANTSVPQRYLRTVVMR